MFNKLPSRKPFPKAKEPSSLSSSENLLSRRKKSENTNPLPSTLTKSSSNKHIPNTKPKALESTIEPKTITQHQKIKESAELKTVDAFEVKTPPRSVRQILGHRRSNSDGEILDDRLLCRNRSTSSLLKNPQPLIKQIDLIKEYEIKCAELLNGLK